MKTKVVCVGGALSLACLLGVYCPTRAEAISSNDWGFVFGVAQVEPDSGSLSAVSVTLNETYVFSGLIENAGATAADLSLAAQAQLSLYIPNGTGGYFTENSGWTAQQSSLTVDAGGSLPFNYPYTFAYTFNLTGAEAAAFIGTGSVDLIARSDVLKTLSGNLNSLTFKPSSTLSADVQVVYYDLPVPEPGVGALLLSGMLGWGVSRLGKRTSR